MASLSVSGLASWPADFHSSSSLLNAILMQNEARGRTGFRQFEFKCGVDPMVRPARGRVRKDLLGGLIGNTNHQVPVTITEQSKIKSGVN